MNDGVYGKSGDKPPFRAEHPDTPMFENPGNGGLGLHADRDACKGSTDTPKGATLQGDSKTRQNGSAKPAPMATSEDGTRRKAEPHWLQPWEYVRSVQPGKNR